MKMTTLRESVPGVSGLGIGLRTRPDQKSIIFREMGSPELDHHLQVLVSFRIGYI